MPHILTLLTFAMFYFNSQLCFASETDMGIIPCKARSGDPKIDDSFSATDIIPKNPDLETPVNPEDYVLTGGLGTLKNYFKQIQIKSLDNNITTNAIILTHNIFTFVRR